MNTEKIGNFIKQKRNEKKLTQEQLANKVYVTNKAVSRWENGKSIPEIETLYLLSKELDVSVNEILEAGENTKDEVKKYFDKNKLKKLLIDIFFIIIIFIFPTICMINCAFTSSSIQVALLDTSFTLEQTLQKVFDYIMNYTLTIFLIPWIILLISYIGYKLNKKNIIHITSILCILIILYVLLFPNAIIGSSLLELMILIINVIELKTIKKLKDN